MKSDKSLLRKNFPMLYLTWLKETVPSCIKCFINFSRMLCILENGALQKDAYLCIDVRVGDMAGHGSREDVSAFLCLIWHDLTRQYRAVLNVSYLCAHVRDMTGHVRDEMVHCKRMHICVRMCVSVIWLDRVQQCDALLSSTCSTAKCISRNGG